MLTLSEWVERTLIGWLEASTDCIEMSKPLRFGVGVCVWVYVGLGAQIYRFFLNVSSHLWTALRAFPAVGSDAVSRSWVYSATTR